MEYFANLSKILLAFSIFLLFQMPSLLSTDRMSEVFSAQSVPNFPWPSISGLVSRNIMIRVVAKDRPKVYASHWGLRRAKIPLVEGDFHFERRGSSKMLHLP